MSPAYETSSSGGGSGSSTPTGLQITGITNSTQGTRQQTWSWGCSSASACTYRYVINQIATSTPTGSYASTTTASQASGNGTYYLHIQAMDSGGTESSVFHYSTLMDNTPPTVTGLSNDANPVQPKTWMWGCSESSCTYRFVIDQNATTTFGSENYTTTSSATKSGAAGTYYLHVQAKDAAGNESTVVHVSAVLGASYSLTDRKSTRLNSSH